MNERNVSAFGGSRSRNVQTQTAESFAIRSRRFAAADLPFGIHFPWRLGVLVVQFASFAFAQSGGGNEVTRTTIDAGGAVRITGGDFELSGTIGQADAGVLAGGDFMIAGGFWFEIPAGDCDADGIVGLGDIGSLADCLDGPGVPPVPVECVCSDFDGDGDIDLRDFAGLQLEFAAQ